MTLVRVPWGSTENRPGWFPMSYAEQWYAEHKKPYGRYIGFICYPKDISHLQLGGLHDARFWGEDYLEVKNQVRSFVSIGVGYSGHIIDCEIRKIVYEVNNVAD
jgi:hypothetical protein